MTHDTVSVVLSWSHSENTVTICESSFVAGEPLGKNFDNTCFYITVKTLQEHRAHMVGPLTICLGLGLAVTYNNGVLEPKIWLSHHRD